MNLGTLGQVIADVELVVDEARVRQLARPIGTPTAINSGDMLGIMMIAVQALEKQTQELKDKGQQIVKLVSRLEILTNALVAAGQLPASALSNAQITAMR